MRTVLLALVFALGAALRPSAPSTRRVSRAVVSMGPYKTTGEEVIAPENRKHSTADSPLTRVKVVRKIDRATKESFAQDIFADAEVEGFIKASGQSMYPKLMRRARAKAMSLGLEWKDDYADGMCAERKQRPMPVKEPEPAEEEAEAEGEEAAAEE